MTAPHRRTARSGADLRILRAAVFAAVCVVLGASGHVLASQACVPLWILLAGFLGTALVTAPFAGRERSLAGIATFLVAGQTVLHTLFGMGQHAGQGGQCATGAMPSCVPGGTPSNASVIARAARLVCGESATTLTPAEARRIVTTAGLGGGPRTGSMSMPGDPAGAHASVLGLLPSLPMLLGHVLAAVAAGWVLRRGDLALLRLIRLSAQGAQTVADGAAVRSLRAAFALVRALHRGLPATPADAPRGLCHAYPEASPPRTAALQHTVIRRGPPAAALALAA
jgi:hypothetical protein